MSSEYQRLIEANYADRLSARTLYNADATARKLFRAQGFLPPENYEIKQGFSFTPAEIRGWFSRKESLTTLPQKYDITVPTHPNPSTTVFARQDHELVPIIRRKGLFGHIEETERIRIINIEVVTRGRYNGSLLYECAGFKGELGQSTYSSGLSIEEDTIEKPNSLGIIEISTTQAQIMTELSLLTIQRIKQIRAGLVPVQSI